MATQFPLSARGYVPARPVTRFARPAPVEKTIAPVPPGALSAHLDAAPSIVMEFETMLAMRRYRFLVYSINVQGQFRYKTQTVGLRRLRVWRIK